MKTNFKKFMGLFLALTMLLGLTVNVNAEGTTPPLMLIPR